MTSLATKLASDLPGDPSLALLELRNRIRSEYLRDDISVLELGQVISVVRAWTVKYGKPIGWQMPTAQVKDTESEYLLKIISSIDDFEKSIFRDIAQKEAQRIFDTEDQIRNKETFGIAVLSLEEKKLIRSHISNIKSIIEISDLPERKRLALLSRIFNLETELETVGSRTDRFFAFMGDAAFALGDFANKAKPFTAEVKSIMRIIMKSRENTEGVRLPKYGDDTLLPPPDGV